MGEPGHGCRGDFNFDTENSPDSDSDTERYRFLEYVKKHLENEMQSHIVGRIMNCRGNRWIVAVIFLLVLSLQVPLRAAGGGGLSVSQLVVALKPDKDPDAMMEEQRELERYLSGRFGIPVKVIIPLSSGVIMEGFRNGTVDVGYLSSTLAAQAMEDGIADIVLAGEIDGETHYTSYWVALVDKPYKSVEDLRGKPVAFASKTSTSGFLIPVWDLYKRGLITPEGGLEAYFGRGNIYYGVGYVSAIDRVFSGDAEAAAVSDYVLDRDKHLTEAQRKQLKVVAEQGPVPTHTLCVRRSLSDSDRQLILDVLSGMNEDNPQLRDRVFTSRLVEVDANQHIEVIREALDLATRLNN